MHAPLLPISRVSLSSDGAIEGYASLFGEVDQARDMVMPGAFAQTLKQRGLRKIPMLFQHDPAEPVGVWLEIAEDFRGLRARGRLIPDVMRAKELLSLIRAGAVDGLSIGYRAARSIRRAGCENSTRSICGKSPSSPSRCSTARG